MTDIKVGDRLHLEVTVTYNNPNYEFMRARLQALTTDGKPDGHVDFSLSRNAPCIVKHIPKPWEPKAGDTAKIKGGYYAGDRVKIIAVDNGQAWIKHLEREHGPGGGLVTLNSLEEASE